MRILSAAAAAAVFAVVASSTPASAFTAPSVGVVPTSTATRQRAPRLRMAVVSDDDEPTTTKKKTTVVAGATGYIGRSVVRECVRQGHRTVALVRDAARAAQDNAQGYFDGADIIQCDVTDPERLSSTLKELAADGEDEVDTIISCLASRSGVKRDAYRIDYQATLNCLEAGRVAGARHFVLLSAFCVKNPWLQFQQAKLEFEAALRSQSDMTYSIVRPTAFFKSVSGQLEVCQAGAPFVMFGDGTITSCNPIAESDLATYLVDCITDKSRENKILNLGGPDEPLTMRQQGEMLFRAIGKEPKFIESPLWLFDAVINGLQFLADLTGSEALEDAAETGRIGKYYAVESMLTTDPSEKFGTITLQQHYDRIAVEGQDYDPYTTMFAKPRAKMLGYETASSSSSSSSDS